MGRIYAGLIPLFLSSLLQANTDNIDCDPNKNYPVPDNNNGRMVFFIQRSLNSNTVIYDVNLTEQGAIESSQPIAIYWRRYNSNGQKKNLKWFESQLAYGIESLDKGNGKFTVFFPSYEDRKAQLYLNSSNEIKLETTISGKNADLYCAYVQLKDNEAIYPQVLHVDIYGRDSKTGEVLFERIIND